MKPTKPNPTPGAEPVPHVPPDSATYLEGPLPKYQSDEPWEINGAPCRMNDLKNPFDEGDGSY